MVGICTFHRGPNHGGYLQAYELCRAVEKLGHEVEIIDYQNPHHVEHERFKPWKYRRPSSLWFGSNKALAFARAKKDLKLGVRIEKKTQIEWGRYETILVGSDVVWDYSIEKLGGEDLYFGGFRKEFEGTLASYAASCGVASAKGPFPDSVKSGLQGFDHVGVRDQATQQLYKNVTGKDCQLVLDPTWLPFGDPLVKNTKTWENKAPYIAVYAFKVDDASAAAICSYARKHGLKVYASGYHHRWADKNFPGLTPLEWVDFLNDSQYVFAGTFHGALYAMRLGKQFAVLSNERIAKKLKTPMEIIELNKHLLNSPEELRGIFEMSRDSSEDLAKVKPAQSKSWNYLDKVLTSS